MLLMVVLATACARAPRQHVVTETGGPTVDELLASRPLEAGANIRVDEIARTAGASVHLVQVRTGEKPHRHLHHDLIVTMVRGHGVLTMGADRRAVSAGDISIVPRGVVHWFVNDGPDVAVTVAAYTPPLDAPDTVAVDVDSPRDAR
jgi:quercetin dioxygenase-like cupin family protein